MGANLIQPDYLFVSFNNVKVYNQLLALKDVVTSVLLSLISFLNEAFTSLKICWIFNSCKKLWAIPWRRPAFLKS